jgi:hypothetical protein
MPSAAFGLYDDLCVEESGLIYTQIYRDNFIVPYFLKDLFNFNNISYFYYFFNLSSFSTKIFLLTIFVFDSSFFYLFYIDCFPKAI